MPDSGVRGLTVPGANSGVARSKMPHSVQLLSMELPCDKDAPAAVRHALDDPESLGRLRDDGLLVASELVTNAVQHSDCRDEHLINVRAELFPDHLLISVHDPGLSGDGAAPASQAQPAFEGPQAGGWGLQIVDRLSRRWGTERPDGYLVWAELARPG